MPDNEAAAVGYSDISDAPVFKQPNKSITAFQTAAPYLKETFDSGAVFFTSDLEGYDFVLNRGLEVPGVKDGERLPENGFIRQCIREKRDIVETVEDQGRGTRLKIKVFPVFADDDPQRVAGTCGIYLTIIHPVFQAFGDFAPLLANCFPEGILILVQDRDQLVHRQGSDKFDIPAMKAGARPRAQDVGPQCMRARKRIVVNVDEKVYGVPCQVTSVPLFDDGSKEAIGALGLIFPRKMAVDLRDIAGKLKSGTLEMARVMEEIASTAGEINLNETKLVGNVQEVQGISGQINDILGFIKGVADQTKMLGLNAAIEAARAGEHGRGFGVVAEEIRKLSDQSKDTANQIGGLTREIFNKVAIVSQASEDNVRKSQEQAAATQEVTASVMEMAGMAETLAELAGKI